MNCIIPFTKDIKFGTSIVEITSISLEHEYTVNSSEILGNFIISGDYKSHEVSVNKEHFEYVLPFSVNLTTRIDTDSVDFAIEDFTYEITDNDTLKVNIEYSINALESREEEEVLKKSEEEGTLDELLDNMDLELEERKDINEEITEEEVSEDNLEEGDSEMITEEVKEENRDNEITDTEQNTVLESISKEDSFVTYHIHVMKETDTIETICAKYNTTSSLLEEYNDLNTITVGEKLIIPDVNE